MTQNMDTAGFIYIEACESGSVFKGLMPDDLNIYVQTASNAVESSFATYCTGMGSSPPDALPCLGDYKCCLDGGQVPLSLSLINFN